MDLFQETLNLLRSYRITPRKHLGQNFVVNSDLLHKMVAYACVNEEDVVLEVGAGLGFLTQFLAQRCRKVISVEVDSKMMKILRKRNLSNVDFIEGDILSISVPEFNKVVSTPPYSIISPLFLLLEKKFDVGVITCQKEFAERLVASIGSKDYGRLTVTTYYRSDFSLLDIVSKNMFYPKPDVDSMIVRFKPKKPPFLVENDETFSKLIQVLFTQRNKKVRNAILPFLRDYQVNEKNLVKYADFLPFHNRRVRELSPEEFGCLANVINQKEREGLIKR
jgi:16S rRNA (adenine1518-N6/adenine1519-N6)-dimethyltransferase